MPDKQLSALLEKGYEINWFAKNGNLELNLPTVLCLTIHG